MKVSFSSKHTFGVILRHTLKLKIKKLKKKHLKSSTNSQWIKNRNPRPGFFEIQTKIPKRPVIEMLRSLISVLRSWKFLPSNCFHYGKFLWMVGLEMLIPTYGGNLNISEMKGREPNTQEQKHSLTGTKSDVIVIFLICRYRHNEIRHV